jgi:methylenetetrahydrofolate dehydrogenase (NADP+)/methenyltetrahydrofolate cyclohydrolase
MDPKKDVDGLHPYNLGSLVISDPDKTESVFSGCSKPKIDGGFAHNKLLPATAMGVIKLLESTGVELKGMHACVIGRSELVGKPVSLLLQQKNCTVTMCHSGTKGLEDITRLADIIVVAVGQPGMIKKEMVKPGAIVIDVGISKVEDKIAGDVDENVSEVAGYLTPVPGGVGPMTVAVLLLNVVRAYKNL